VQVRLDDAMQHPTFKIQKPDAAPPRGDINLASIVSAR
jgi:hypothetical protein